MRVIDENDFTELDSVAVDKRALTICIGQLVVVNDDRVGLREILDEPLAVGVGEARMPSAYGRGAKSDVLRGRSGVASHEQLKRLSGNANKPNLAMARRARQHFQAPGEQLNGLIRRSEEANGFSARRMSIPVHHWSGWSH